MALKDTMQALANDLAVSGKDRSGEVYTVSASPDDEIVVVAVRQRKGRRVIRLDQHIERVFFQESGAPCSRCGGTGKA